MLRGLCEIILLSSLDSTTRQVFLLKPKTELMLNPMLRHQSLDGIHYPKGPPTQMIIPMLYYVMKMSKAINMYLTELLQTKIGQFPHRQRYSLSLPCLLL